MPVGSNGLANCTPKHGLPQAVTLHPNGTEMESQLEVESSLPFPDIRSFGMNDSS